MPSSARMVFPWDHRQDPGSVQRADSSLRLQKLPGPHWVSRVPIHQQKLKKNEPGSQKTSPPKVKHSMSELNSQHPGPVQPLSRHHCSPRLPPQVISRAFQTTKTIGCQNWFGSAIRPGIFMEFPMREPPSPRKISPVAALPSQHAPRLPSLPLLLDPA